MSINRFKKLTVALLLLSTMAISSVFVVGAVNNRTSGSVTVGTGYFTGEYTSFGSVNGPANTSGWSRLTPATAVSVSAATNRFANNSVYGRVTASYMGTQYLTNRDITQHVYANGAVTKGYWLNQPTTVY